MLKKETCLKHILLVIAAAVAFLIGSVTAVYAADETDTDIDAGTYDGVPWRITADYELLIGEEGQEYNFEYRESREYYSFPWGVPGTRDNIKKVAVLGTVHGNGSFRGMFGAFSSMTSIDVSGLDTGEVTDMSWMFGDCFALTNLDVSGFDTGKVIDMDNMFERCTSLRNIDVSGFNTGKVTDMSKMFWRCTSLTNVNLDGLTTGDSCSMYSMFYECTSLSNVDLSGMDISGVTDMSEMFRGCTSLTSVNLNGLKTGDSCSMYLMFFNCTSLPGIDLSNMDTSRVTKMDSMFAKCTSLSGIILTGMDTSKVTSMGSMFSECCSLKSIDVSGLDTSNVTNMGGMFSSCTSLVSIDMSGIDTGNVRSIRGMFSGCSSLTSIDISGLNTSNVGSMDRMFSGCGSLTSIDISGLDTSNVTNLNGLFEGCSSLISVNVPRMGTGKVIDVGDMFRGCKSLTGIDLSGMDTSNVTQMRGLFKGCSSLTSIDVSGLDTSNVTDMREMFEGCSSLIRIDVSGFDTGNVTNMSNMFQNCSALINMDMSGMDASKATSVSWMFSGCRSLTSVDMSGMDLSKVTDMDYMFIYCYALARVNLSGMNISSVTNMNSMFYSCHALTSIDMSELDTGVITDMTYMFNGCISLTRLDLGGLKTGDLCSMYRMFGACNALKTISLPSSWKRIGDNAFQECVNLEEVEISNLRNWCAIDFSTEYSNPLNASPDAVLLLNGGTGSKVSLDEGITQIPDRTFNGWKYLKEVTLPTSLTKIGAGAFEGTDSLRTVNVDSLDQWLNMEFATETSSPLAGGKAELRVRSGSDYDALSEVVIDQSIGGIPAYAFSGCRSLRSAVIPDSITTIGTGAFASSEALSRIVIPDSVSALPERMFADCKDLKKILIPESVTDIDKTAFTGCSADLVIYGTPGSAAESFAAQKGIKFLDYSEYDAMEAGSIDNDIRWILTGGSLLTIEGTGEDVALETGAFEKIANKVTGVKIKGISRIGAGAFSNMLNLERVTIDINTPVKSIDPAAFAGTGVEICCYPNSYDVACRALPGFTVKKLSGSRSGNVTWTYNENTGTLMLSSGSEEFGADFEPAFKDLDIRRVEFSESFACKALPAGLFSGCASLTEVKLAAQTTEIGDEAFKDCTNLRRVTWHEGVTKIGEGTFENCVNLQQILLADSVLVNEYDQEMEDTAVEIPAGVKAIPQRAFRSCRAIREVDWYEDAETEQTGGRIGASAFENCSGLLEIGIPEHVASIGASAFRSCEVLCALDGELLFGENLDALGAQAFSDCRKIQTMSFGKDLSSIGNEALGTNTELTVEAPESAANLKGYCRNAGMTFVSLEGMGDTQIQQDAYVKLAKSSITVKAGKSKKIAYTTNGKVKGVKASGTSGKVSVSKSGHKVKFTGKSARSGVRVKLNFDMKKAKDVTKSVSVTVKKASSGLGGWTGDKQILRAEKQQITFSSDAASVQKVRITRSEGAEGALICTVSKKGIVKYTMKADGTLKITPVKAGKVTLTVYAEADDVFEASEPVRITVTVKARPAKVTAKVKKLSKTKARVSWKKVNGVKSYQIQVSKSKTFKKKKTYSAKSTALKKTVKITKGKKNYIRVRYKLANGKAGKWSKTLVVKK